MVRSHVPHEPREILQKPPLIGRAAEMQDLSVRLTSAARGHGGVLFLTGESGIGKTRLAREALAVATARKFQVLQGRAYSVESCLAYAPILDAVGPFLRRLDIARQSRLVGGLPDLGRLFSGLRLAPPEPLSDPALEKTRLFEAVACLIERLAGELPVLLLMDDLQWADPASLELFHYIARGLADQRVLALATCTSPQLDLTRGLRPMMSSLQHAGLAREIVVSRLDAQSVGLLTRSLLGDEPPPMLSDLLSARAGGTPLYVEALVQAFVDGGQLSRRGGGWELRSDAANVLPATVREIVRQRLERLEPTERRVLDLIVVAGSPASHALLRTASGMEDGVLLDALRLLRSTGLIQEEGAELEVVYRVTHPLLQEVAYAELPEVQRRRTHAAFADALEQLKSGDTSAGSGQALERLAHHYRGAGQETDGARALEVLLAAGERAHQAHADDEAARHFGAALALVRAGYRPAPAVGYPGPLLPMLLHRLGEAWERVGELGAAVAVWAEALAEYERLDDLFAAARLRRLLALTEWDRGHFTAAQAHLGAGLAALAGRDPSPELAGLHLVRITFLSRLGDTRAAVAAAEQLTDLATRLNSPRAAAQAHLAQASVYLEQWKMTLARRHALSALDAAQTAGDHLLIHRSYDRLAVIALASGDHRLAQQHALAGLDLAQRLRAPSLELSARQWVVLSDFFAGAWDQGLSGCIEAVSLARRLGNMRGAVVFLSQWAMVLGYRGDFDVAESRLADARAASRDGSLVDRHAFGAGPIVEGRLALERGDVARAYAATATPSQLSESNPTGGLPPLAVPMGLALLAETQLAVGQPESALATARILHALDAPFVQPSATPGRRETSYPVAAAVRVEGLARQALGESATALACLEQSAADFAALEMPFELARTRLDWATLATLADAALRQSAATAAAESLAIFERLGTRRYAQRARQLCHQLGMRPAAARPVRSAGGPLSQRELEVARLAVEGLTAPEIAARLFISPHTATTHLRRIYSRLGISSRAALARYVIEAGLLDPPP
ncbi:MAG: AAA family ATPase [Chloroflexi bacterium]|nr:AAA family ATPase [Chloroflexota bacterium]